MNPDEQAIVNDLLGKTDRELLLTAIQKIDGMEQTHSKILTVAEEIKAEVGPIVEKLSSHPMFRMILGGK